MVPMLTWGLVRSNFAFATEILLWTGTWSGLAAAAFTRPSPSRFRWLGSGLAPLLAALRCSLARRLRDDLLRDVLRNLGVGVELHGVARPALGPGPQVAD